ncbi:MAG: hypothetical protein DME06_08080 [Candidatus Rokuibacteriota bacterium]|nr:MAG: hypothetical protein DME06_08080 [Candidatus Rokubacteria bacterium]
MSPSPRRFASVPTAPGPRCRSRLLGAQSEHDVVDELGEPIGNFLPLALATLELVHAPGHLVEEPIAFALGGLEAVAKLLVLVDHSAQPLVLVLDRVDPVVQAIVVAHDGQEHVEQTLAVVEPPAGLIPGLFRFDTGHGRFSSWTSSRRRSEPPVPAPIRATPIGARKVAVRLPLPDVRHAPEGPMARRQRAPDDHGPALLLRHPPSSASPGRRIRRRPRGPRRNVWSAPRRRHRGGPRGSPGGGCYPSPRGRAIGSGPRAEEFGRSAPSWYGGLEGDSLGRVSTEQARTSTGAPRVLVVEDEENTRVLFGDILRHLAYEPILARSAEAARAAIESAVPDIILLDVRLPLMSGYEFLRLRAIRDSKIPIVAVSGAATESDARSCLHFGALDFLRKPVALDLLRAVLQYAAVRAREGHRDLEREAGNRRRSVRPQVTLPVRVVEQGGPTWSGTCVDLSTFRSLPSPRSGSTSPPATAARRSPCSRRSSAGRATTTPSAS